MNWNQHGVFSQAPPGATGMPQMPQGQQVVPPSPFTGYDVSQIPGAQPPQGYNGPQPGVPGTPVAQPHFTNRPPAAPPQQHWPQQAQQQQPPAQPAQAPQLDDNTILDGAGVPPRLRGRTWGEAKRLYSALETDWMQRNQRPAPPPAQAPSAQGQPQPARDPRQFWQNPDERIAEVVGQVIEQRLAPTLQPMIQRTQASAVREAQQIAAQGISDFDYLSTDIMQIVSRARPEDLMNPDAWVAAADMARGQRLRSGQYRPVAQPGVGGGAPPAGPGASVPAAPTYNPPPVHQFFSEAPSAPSPPGTFGAQRQPSQEDQFYAQKYQMPVADYMAWKYGTGAPQSPMGVY